MAQGVLDWLDSPEKMAILEKRFGDLHLQLQRDTPKLATDAIEAILQS
jgi:lipid-A-disaccharide synthase